MGPSVRSDWRDDDLAALPSSPPPNCSVAACLTTAAGATGRLSPSPDRRLPHPARHPETTDNLKYDISMQKAQIKPFEIQQTILQPRPYDFASAETVWLTRRSMTNTENPRSRQKKPSARSVNARSAPAARRMSAMKPPPAVQARGPLRPPTLIPAHARFPLAAGPMNRPHADAAPPQAPTTMNT